MPQSLVLWKEPRKRELLGVFIGTAEAEKKVRHIFQPRGYAARTTAGGEKG